MVRWPFAFVVAYVALVLGVDALEGERVRWPVDWSIFRWRFADLYVWTDGARAALGIPDSAFAWMRSRLAQRVDLYTLTFRLFVPFLLCLRGMDWGAFRFARFKRVDWLVLAAIAGAGAAAMLLIPLVPELRETYPDLSHLDAAAKRDWFYGKMLWIASWLVGWEFMHRYMLLRSAVARCPRYGWLLLPLSEGTFHLLKPLPEAAGMVLLSIVLTRWALARRSVLLPFLAHFAIELEVALFMLFA